MRKRTAFLVAISLTLSTSPALAAIKAGSTCPKKGATQTSAGKKFICATSGKKLVWKAVETNVVVTPEQTAQENPAPTSFDDLESNYKGISYAAWSKARAKINASSDTKIPFELLLGAHTKLNNDHPEIAITKINKLFSGAVLPAKIIFVAFTYQDRDWAMAKMEEVVPSAASAWIKDIACPTENQCLGGGSFHNELTNNALIIIGTGVDPYNKNNAFSGTLEAHEYTHSIEQSSANSLRPAVNLLQSPWPPNWMWEGTAQFAQHAAIYSDSYSEYLQYRKASSGELFQSSTWNAQYIQDYFQTNLTKEWGEKYARWRQYDLGAMFVEVLVALKGPDTAMKLFSESVNGGGFESAFQRLYGAQLSAVLPQISRAIAKELGH